MFHTPIASLPLISGNFLLWQLLTIYLVVFFPGVGRRGQKLGCRHCMGRFFSSCVRLVYFLRKSKEFHVKQTESQIILLIAIAKRCPLSYSLHDHSRFPLSYLLHNHSPIAPNCSLITPQSNYASVYPPSFDTLEWMKMQIGLPLSVLMKLFHITYSLPQRQKNWTLLQR